MGALFKSGLLAKLFSTLNAVNCRADIRGAVFF